MLIITITLTDPGLDWIREDPRKAMLIRERIEAVVLDAAVNTSKWDGGVRAWYSHPVLPR